jgi:hypothetical protein
MTMRGKPASFSNNFRVSVVIIYAPVIVKCIRVGFFNPWGTYM